MPGTHVDNHWACGQTDGTVRSLWCTRYWVCTAAGPTYYFARFSIVKNSDGLLNSAHPVVFKIKRRFCHGEILGVPTFLDTRVEQLQKIFRHAILFPAIVTDTLDPYVTFHQVDALVCFGYFLNSTNMHSDV